MTKYFQGYFKVIHPEKYNGRDVTKVRYMSSWEFALMRRLDHSSKVISWSSESTIVPYSDPVTGKFKRYFPNFLVTLREKNGKSSTWLLEVKPLHQTKQPRRGEKKSEKKFLTEAFTYARNLAKWEAAKRYADKKGYIFQLVTEKELAHWGNLK